MCKIHRNHCLAPNYFQRSRVAQILCQVWEEVESIMWCYNKLPSPKSRVPIPIHFLPLSFQCSLFHPSINKPSLLGMFKELNTSVFRNIAEIPLFF